MPHVLPRREIPTGDHPDGATAAHWHNLAVTAAAISREAALNRRPSAVVASVRRLLSLMTDLDIPLPAPPRRRHRPPTAPAPAPLPTRPCLTPTELRILALIATGGSNAEIAKILTISEDTVKSHCRSLYRKLRARDRAHAVAIGFQQGILTIPRPDHTSGEAKT